MFTYSGEIRILYRLTSIQQSLNLNVRLAVKLYSQASTSTRNGGCNCLCKRTSQGFYPGIDLQVGSKHWLDTQIPLKIADASGWPAMRLLESEQICPEFIGLRSVRARDSFNGELDQ